MSGSAVALGRLQSIPTVRIRRRDVVVFAPLALMIGYFASPYVAIARLGYAIRTNDVAVLTEAVDWNRVRAGLDHEIVGSPPQASASTATTKVDDDLPAFGESFAATATASALDTTVTPTGLEAMLANDKHAAKGLLAEARSVVDGAVFIGLNRFEIRLPSETGAQSDTIRIGFRFSASHGWRVERVVLPPAMIDAPAQGT